MAIEKEIDVLLKQFVKQGVWLTMVFLEEGDEYVGKASENIIKWCT